MASKNSNGESYGKGRTRNFATVVYPDSAPDNWQEILSDQFVPAFVSPFHDMDADPDGEVKKPHYHVLIAYDSTKTKEQAEALMALINGVGCEVVQSLRGYSRYLCHLDNPDKHQYPIEDVRAFCGADYLASIGLPTDKYKAIKEIIEYVKQNDLYSYSDLLDYCAMEKYDWFRVLCDNGTVVVKEYLKSRSWTSCYKSKKEVSKDAGANNEQPADGCQAAGIYSEEI